MKQEIKIHEDDRPRVDRALDLVERLVEAVEIFTKAIERGFKGGK